jgi:hypothetical protein
METGDLFQLKKRIFFLLKEISGFHGYQGFSNGFQDCALWFSLVFNDCLVWGKKSQVATK